MFEVPILFFPIYLNYKTQNGQNKEIDEMVDRLTALTNNLK